MAVSSSRTWLVLVALALSILVVGIDLTVLNVALPTIGPALHASTTDLQWFVDSYSLVLAAALLPAGLLGDRYGRKTVLIIGLAMFCVTSAACAYAPSAGALIGVRAVLGLAAAAIIPLSLAVLPVLFTAEERPKAIAVVMSATMLGYPLGPVLGGWLLTHFWWGSVFLINVPVTLVALVAVVLLMPQSRNPKAARFDGLGALLSGAGLVGLTYGVIEAGQDGWSSPDAFGPLVGGALLLAVFVVNSRRAAARPDGEPLVDLSLFRSRNFSWGTALATLVSFALFGLMFAMPLYFQDVQGADALGTGLRMLPLIGGLVVGGALAPRLQTARARRPGEAPRSIASPRSIVAFGFAVIAAGLALGSVTKSGSGEGYAALWFTIVGFGLGFALPASMNAAMGALSKERSGMGSAVIMALRQVGATIGVAVLGTVLSGAYRNRLDTADVTAQVKAAAGQSVSAGTALAERLGSDPLLTAVRGSFVHAMDTMLLVCTAIAAVAAVLAVLFLPGRRAVAPAVATPGDTSGDTHVGPAVGPAADPTRATDPTSPTGSTDPTDAEESEESIAAS